MQYSVYRILSPNGDSFSSVFDRTLYNKNLIENGAVRGAIIRLSWSEPPSKLPRNYLNHRNWIPHYNRNQLVENGKRGLKTSKNLTLIGNGDLGK